MILLNLLLSAIYCVAAKPVEISLEAPWRPPVESALLLETLASYNASSFFPLLSVLLTERQKSTGNDTAALFSAVQKYQFLQNSTLGLVEQEMKLGTLIPYIEGHYQVFETTVENQKRSSSSEISSYDDCPVVVWIEGKFTCDITDLYALQETDEPETPLLFLNDHVIGSGKQWMVAYADILSPEFVNWHGVLLEMAQKGKISYILRHRPSISNNKDEVRKANLAGYGSGIHVKRTDYLVVDDRQLNGEELKLDLEAPHRVQASKIPFLGFRAAKKIRELSEESGKSGRDQFELLKDVSFNFPEYAPELAAAASDEDEKDELHSNKLQLFGTNAIFLNGQLLKAKDVFQFYEAIHNEIDVVSSLKMLLPENTDIPRLLSSGVAFDNNDYEHTTSDNESLTKYRYDLRGRAVNWINDIEKDGQYQQFDDDISLLHSGGAFIPLRKNMHSIVLAGDLTDPKMLSSLKSLLIQVGEQLPLQVGVVAPNEEWLRVAKLGREGSQIFLQYLIRGQSPKDSLNAVLKMFEKEGIPVQAPLADPSEWLHRFGVDVTAGPVVFINGIPQAHNNWHELAATIFENDAEYLRSLDSIKQKDSLRDLLFATGLPARNRLLDPLEKDLVFSSWPMTPPIQAFKNPAESNKTKHSVLLSSSFETREVFDVVLALLKRSQEKNDVDVYVRPLNGINERFYAAMLDTTYNVFRFSTDLFTAARAHFFDRKTAPRVLEVAGQPRIPATQLAADVDSIIIDGRSINLSEIIQDETPDLLDRLLDRETRRLNQIAEKVPGISGIGVAALTKSVQTRSMITPDDEPDFTIENNSESMRFTVIVDPASAEGQELIALVSVAVGANADVDVHLSPAELSEIPTRFYRPVFDRNAEAEFLNLSDDVLYTAELVEPQAWLTVASESAYDLDNIILNTVKENKLRAVYSLKSLLVEGFASGPDAPGTSLDIRYMNGSKVGDTAVMANLGYFQLSAPRPGAYQVCHGSKDHSFLTQAGTTDCLLAPLFSFEGSKLSTVISATPPTIRTLSNTNKGSLWSKVKGLTGAGLNGDDVPRKTATINIFTVASGHLYERFASIMMLSVMRHTKHTVKFWLIEDFMSPKFKEFVPEFAKEHGFDYEFVSYKWPSWLRKQTEKQRQIWGYKMLFLDVLFPQSLSNVIFVDSDQIVRTDFKELLDIDIGKAPYAFTPMGDDRAEMEPYRFWKQGYWKKSLLDNGYPYHISALYRVDLDRFRKQKVGDIIRQHYQRLSADPANLANLDQDLPNSLQPVVPLFSLPQEWLWCETWCSDAGLSWAKTIDLCNNPLTKEPKLDRARRQIPEWTEYDNIVADFAKKLDERQSNVRRRQDAEMSSTERRAAEQHHENSDESSTNYHDEL